jgi:ABC-type uncharacterized transport system permease subunit
MTPIAHVLAVTLYLGAAAVAAAPLARPVHASVRWVVTLIALGVVAHLVGLAAAAFELGQLPFIGLGPALSVAGLLLAMSLLAAEVLADETTLTLVAAPLAALCTAAANLIGITPVAGPEGLAGAWLLAHIALSFGGIAAYGTAAAAGAMYLAEHRELKSRRFGSVFRLFPPLQTLDRVNHLAVLAGWLGLTLGVALATLYSVTYRQLNVGQVVWGATAWLAISAIAIGRLTGGLGARRAALVSSISFVGVVALYLAARLVVAEPGRFL